MEVSSGFQRVWTVIAVLLTASTATMTVVNTVMSRDREVTAQVAGLTVRVDDLNQAIRDMKASLMAFESRMDKAHISHE